MTTFAANQSRFAPLPSLATMGKDFTYLVLGLPVGIAVFSFAVTAFALSAGLAITLVGVPLLILTLLASRWIAKLERERARMVIDEPVVADRPLSGSTMERSKALLGDRSAWTGAAWSLLMLPIGTAGFTVAITLWSTAVGFITSPLWYWATDSSDDTIPLLRLDLGRLLGAARADRPRPPADHRDGVPRPRRRHRPRGAGDPGLAAGAHVNGGH